MPPRTLTRPHPAGLLALAPLLMAASLTPAGLPGYAPGTGVDAAAARRISRWALAEYAVPGAAIALVQDGRLTLVEGFGVRDLATGAPTTADTVFQLASVSKTFTAATVAALVDRKTLGWEQPMVSLLPGGALRGHHDRQPSGRTAVVRHPPGVKELPRPQAVVQRRQLR